MNAYMESWRTSSHKHVACTKCHYEPGFLNHMKGKWVDGQVSLAYFISGKTPERPHAEINALSQAGERAHGSTLYVTLEPCCHYGRTPPCVDRIIQAGIRRVVAACEDPNPAVSGKGFAALRAAGLDRVGAHPACQS
jgi:tRNA(Arg) A34 adenosine deaminase TadA